MSAPLTAAERAGLQGFDPREGFLKIGPQLSATEPGFAVVVSRSARNGPWDLLYVDRGDRDSPVPIHATAAAGTDDRLQPGEDRGTGSPGIPPGTPGAARFRTTLEVSYLEGRALRRHERHVVITVEPGPAGSAPESMAWRVFAAKAARVTVDGRELTVLLADGNSDGIFGAEDPWMVTESAALLAAPFTAATAREVGERAWAAGRPWNLRLTGSAGSEGFLQAREPRGSRADDEDRRGIYPADRAAPRAAAPLRCAPETQEGGERPAADGPAGSPVAVTRPRLIVFTAPGCAQCETMERLVFSARPVVEVASGIDCVRVDVAVDPRALSERGLTGVPAGVLLDAGGREIGHYEGYAGVASLAALLRKAER